MAPRRPIVVLVGLSLLLAGCGSLTTRTVVPPSAAAPVSSAAPTGSELERFYEQQVNWSNCGIADCARVQVPLDYADPSGAVVELAITRVPAKGERIGSLFVNPGGPGGSAVDYARAADYIVTKQVRAHYDIVGVDPRGVAKSDPVVCLSDEQIDFLIAADGTPDDAAEEQAVIDGSARIGQQCELHGDPLYAHMGTVASARDLDIVRSAIGQDVLTYLGKSYGSLLGATYAELFPERVGRMVLDGALPASLDLVTVTRDQAEAFEVAVADFARDCLAYETCPLTGKPDEAVQQLRDWLTSLDSDPLVADERILNEPVAAYAVLSYLYFPDYDYPELRGALAAAMNDDDPAPLLTLLDQRISRTPDGRYLDNSTNAFYAVTCLDRPFTGTVEDARRYAQEWAVSAPTFGPSLAWGLLACKDWPATAEAITETTASGSNPILVVTTRNDPATPYEWGVTMASELENARLLTRDGFGHTAYVEGSDCIDSAVDAYLLTGELPEQGLVCA